MPCKVLELEFDDWNEAEMAKHRVSVREVRQVLDNEPVFVRNTKAHKAPIIMIGPTYGGRMLTVPLGETAIPGVWRPATGWSADAQECAKYRQARGS